MDKLNFLTAGIPLRAGNKGYEAGFKILDEMNLDGLELEFVRGVRTVSYTHLTLPTIRLV